MIAEQEIAEAVRIGIALGDARVVFDFAGGNGLALIVMGIERGLHAGGGGGGRGEGLGDLKGIAPEFLYLERDFKAGIARQGVLFAPVLGGFRCGKFIRIFEPDEVGAGLPGGQGVG